MTARRVLGCTLIFVVGIAMLVVLAVLAPTVLCELSPSVELAYKVDGSLDAVRQNLHHRCGRGSIVTAREPDLVLVRVLGGSPAEISMSRQLIEMQGQLDFKLVVDKNQLGSDAAVKAMIEEIKAKKAAGTWLPYTENGTRDRYDVAKKRDNGEWVLLDNKGVSGSLLVDAHRSLDNLARPAVGFTFGREGGQAFYDFTSQNVGRALAIVLDGTVVTAPIIHSAIGESGIIEGGAMGFTQDEAARLIAVLGAGSLPGKLAYVGQTNLPATPGRACGLAGAVIGVGAVLLGGSLALAIKQPPAREMT